MANPTLKNIFLSASIPLLERDQKFYESADVIAIRDAVIALCTVVLSKHRLIWGGHPSITPIVNFVMQRMGLNIQEHVTIYQSNFFEKYFPSDNNEFENIVFTENINDKNSSIDLMRIQMLKNNKFSAGVFIGGMEGILDEFNLFREYHPEAILLPIASTGAAAKIVYETYLPDKFKNKRLEKDYGYMSLFKDLLVDRTLT